MAARDRTISARHRNILWALSGNMCAFRHGDTLCAQRLVGEVRSLYAVGEMAHVVGLHRGAARFDPRVPKSALNAHENLILLCPTHHRMVDDPDARRRFSASALRSMKAAHELWVADRLKRGLAARPDEKTHLRADFEIDPDDGEPTRAWLGGAWHYVLNLWVVNPPPETQSVVYGLHPTFKQPAIRITKGPNFRLEELRTYGDFFVKVTLKRHPGDTTPTIFHASLSKALRDNYGTRAPKAVRKAIRRLSEE